MSDRVRTSLVFRARSWAARHDSVRVRSDGTEVILRYASEGVRAQGAAAYARGEIHAASRSWVGAEGVATGETKGRSGCENAQYCMPLGAVSKPDTAVGLLLDSRRLSESP